MASIFDPSASQQPDAESEYKQRVAMCNQLLNLAMKVTKKGGAEEELLREIRARFRGLNPNIILKDDTLLWAFDIAVDTWETLSRKAKQLAHHQTFSAAPLKEKSG